MGKKKLKTYSSTTGTVPSDWGVDPLKEKNNTGLPHYGTTLKPISRNPGKRKNTKKIKNFWNQTA